MSRRVRFPAESISVERAFGIIAAAVDRQLQFDISADVRLTRIQPGSLERRAGEAIAIVSVLASVRAEANSNGDLRVTPSPPTPLPAVSVRATQLGVERRESWQVGTTATSMQELGRAPIIIAPDVLRLIRLLPGVSARNDLSLDFNVRGGESSQNLVLIDGYPIYNPFHLGGVLGTFIEPAVGDVDLQAGAFPARSSGRLSGLLTASTRRDDRAGMHGALDVSLLATTAAVSRRSNDGSRYWLLGARRTYADLVARTFDFDIPYYFQDAHGYVEQRIGERHQLSATSVYSLDRSGQYKGEARFRVGWGNTVVGATLRSTYPGLIAADSVSFVQRASYTGFDGFTKSAERNLDFESRVSDVRVSSAATWARGRNVMEAGVEIGRITTAYTGDAPYHWMQNLLVIGANESDQASLGAWYSLSTTRGRHQLSAGLRADVVEAAGSALSPRFALRSTLSENVALIFSAGQHVQWIHSSVRQEQPVRPLDFWMGGASLPMSRATTITAGMDRRDAEGRQFRLEGFYRRYSSIPDRSILDDPLIRGDEFELLKGTSKGFDFLLRPTSGSAWNGWLAYTFALSRRQDARGSTFAPAHDRRHELNVVATRQLGSWAFSSRLNVASGIPYTPVWGEFVRPLYDPTTNRWGVGSKNRFRDETVHLSGFRNSARLPMAHRLDLGIARTGRSGTARAVPYFSVANAYGALNPWLYYDEYGITPERTSIAGFRLLPTFGFRYGF